MLMLKARHVYITCPFVMFLIVPNFKMFTGDQEQSEKPFDKVESLKSQLLQKFSPRLVKQILELLCDESVSLYEALFHSL